MQSHTYSQLWHCQILDYISAFNCFPVFFRKQIGINSDRAEKDVCISSGNSGLVTYVMVVMCSLGHPVPTGSPMGLPNFFFFFFFFLPPPCSVPICCEENNGLG